MVVEATKTVTYKISARNCTPEEVAKLLKDIGSPDVYAGNVEVQQEYKYDCDGYPTPTGFYAVIFSGGAKSVETNISREEACKNFDNYTVEAFYKNVPKILQS